MQTFKMANEWDRGLLVGVLFLEYLIIDASVLS